MDSRRDFAAGHVVYLTAEVRGAARIHEIGTRALVVGASGAELTLEVGGDVVACSAVEAAPAMRSPRRVPRAPLGPATA